MKTNVNEKFLIHYEEYDNQDYEAPLRIEDLTSFYETLRYSRDKANLIVGGLEKLTFLQTQGIGALVEDDERFYLFMKEKFRKKAKAKFGREGYLLCHIDSLGNYEESVYESFVEANRAFDALAKAGADEIGLYRHTQQNSRGWAKKPVREHNVRKSRRMFVMRHIKGRKE